MTRDQMLYLKLVVECAVSDHRMKQELLHRFGTWGVEQAEEACRALAQEQATRLPELVSTTDWPKK